eukprot:scaffold166654_cov20-Tisochrysis_lutea.AAC.1
MGRGQSKLAVVRQPVKLLLRPSAIRETLQISSRRAMMHSQLKLWRCPVSDVYLGSSSVRNIDCRIALEQGSHCATAHSSACGNTLFCMLVWAAPVWARQIVNSHLNKAAVLQGPDQSIPWVQHPHHTHFEVNS